VTVFVYVCLLCPHDLARLIGMCACVRPLIVLQMTLLQNWSVRASVLCVHVCVHVCVCVSNILRVLVV